jgi:hypothetical protein
MIIRVKNCFSGEEQMSILTANLKHLYQRRGLWLVYAFLGSVSLPGIMMISMAKKPKAGDGMFVMFVMWTMVIVGIAAATIQIEVLSKPFSFCLPGHRKIARKFMLLAGLIVSLSYSLIFLRYPGLDLWQLLPVVLSAFSALLVFYWFGIVVTFLTNNQIGRNQVRWAGLLPFILIVGMFFGLLKILENMIIEFPMLFITIGILSSVLAWRWLGDDSIARQYCAKPVLGTFGAWDRSKMQKFSQASIAVKGDKIFRKAPQVEQFFLARMLKCSAFGVGRYIWGGLYKAFGPALSQGMSNQFLGAFIFFLVLSFFGYMDGYMGNEMKMMVMLFIMPCIAVIVVQLPFYSSMLIAGGRRERIFTSMTLFVTIAILITTAVTVLAAMTILMEKILPDITLWGQTFTFKAADLRLFFIPLLIIPLGFIFNLVFYQKAFYRIVFLMLAFMLLFPLMMILSKELSMMLISVRVITGIVLSWFILTVFLWYVCMKRSLTGQSR